MLGCRYRKLAVWAAVAAALAGPAAGRAPAASRNNGSHDPSRSAPALPPVPPGWLGVQVDGPVFSRFADLGHELDLMAVNGVQSIRTEIAWRVAQPYRQASDIPPQRRASYFDFDGIPTNFDEVDRIVGAAASHGLDVLPLVWGTPAWDAIGSTIGSPPRHPSRFASFVRALVLRYGPHGAFWAAHPEIPARPIRAWQIWNEPSLPYFWSRQPFARPYVALLRATHRAIKSADPRAEVVLAGLPNTSWLDLAKIYRAGGRPWFDVAAVHPYTFYVRNVIKLIGLYRGVMARYGDGRKPLVVSEFTWSSGRGYVRETRNFATLTERGQARRLAQGLRALAAVRRRYRIAQVDWYTWLSPPLGNRNAFNYSGLRRVGSHGRGIVDKPALGAFRRTAAVLERCQTVPSSTACR